MLTWYKDGDLRVVVEAEPGKPVRVGTGETKAEALDDRLSTPIGWRPGCVPAAIRWAANEGWVSGELAEEVEAAQ